RQRPARFDQPSCQGDSAPADPTREVQERDAVDFPLPGPDRVGGEDRNIQEQGAGGVSREDSVLLLPRLQHLHGHHRASRAATAVHVDEEAGEGAEAPRAVQERAVPHEAAQVERAAAGARQVEPGHRGGRGAPAAGPEEGDPPRHGRVWLRQLPHRLLP
ncbi:hypothetical protein ACJX0J_027654, partial [Zea mays]